MQSTHPRLHIRDRADAHKLFEAVRQGILPAVTRRLNESERTAHIKSGAVFVWEQSDQPMGLRRWTEQRHWSQSRMREPFLFYDEKIPHHLVELERESSPSRDAFKFVSEAGARIGKPSPTLSHLDRSAASPPIGLVKQAYSSWVLVAPNKPPRKWHVTAYFTYKDLADIPCIDDVPMLRDIQVPEGMYRSGKAKFKPSTSESVKVQYSPDPNRLRHHISLTPSLTENDSCSSDDESSDYSGSVSSSKETDSLRRSERTGTFPPVYPHRDSYNLPPIKDVNLGIRHYGREMYPNTSSDYRFNEDARLIRILNANHIS